MTTLSLNVVSYAIKRFLSIADSWVLTGGPKELAEPTVKTNRTKKRWCLWLACCHRGTQRRQSWPCLRHQKSKRGPCHLVAVCKSTLCTNICWCTRTASAQWTRLLLGWNISFQISGCQVGGAAHTWLWPLLKIIQYLHTLLRTFRTNFEFSR